MLLLVKYGGNPIESTAAALDPVIQECAAFVAAGGRLVLVHGGGPQIDAALERQGAGTRRVAGLRVTDAQTLAVTEDVLCGSVNKSLVRALLRCGVAAAGVSGQDGGSVRARRRGAPDGSDLGFVGEVASVDPGLLLALLRSGFTPVVAPLAIDETAGGALNINADETAGAIAGALGVDAYINVTSVDRVRLKVERPETALDRIGRVDAQNYVDDGTFAGGMRPKIAGALTALGTGAKRALICGAKPDGLAAALDGDATEIV